MKEVESELIRIECWDKATHCLATSYIFQRKQKKFGFFLRLNSLLGLIIPLFVGAMVTTYGLEMKNLANILWLVSPFAVIQILISGISLVYEWENKLSYSMESLQANRELHEKYINIAKFPPEKYEDLKVEFDKLLVEDNARTLQDEKHNFTAKENRKGLKYALMILQKECAICKKIPLNLQKTNCKNCG